MEYVEHKAVWWPARVRIAGLRLLPPTLGQVRLLEALNSPFITGGMSGPVDCALALYVLATPWRRARKRLASPWRMACIVAWLRLRRLRAPRWSQSALEIGDFVNRALWTPERYVRDDAPPASIFAPASGLAVRLAMRAAALPLAGLCHGRRGSWDCLWDIPVDAVIAYSVAQAERDGQEYASREEGAPPPHLRPSASSADNSPPAP